MNDSAPEHFRLVWKCRVLPNFEISPYRNVLRGLGYEANTSIQNLFKIRRTKSQRAFESSENWKKWTSVSIEKSKSNFEYVLPQRSHPEGRGTGMPK